MNREGGVGFNYVVFENRVREWGSRVRAATIMSSVDCLCERGYTKREGKSGEANTLFMVEEHATIEKFRTSF